jgi:serpin B
VGINRWVDAATHHRIPALLGAGAVTAATTLTLVNAVYIKAPWLWPFASTATVPTPFATPAGNVQVPTMHMVGHLSYVKSNDFEAIELPYADGSMTMLIVLPDVGKPLSTAVTAVASGRIEGRRTLVSLSLPRFEIETSADLGQALAALGVTDAFDAERADLTGIAVAEPPLFVSGVIHRANITVDEHGTEAAAATAVMVAGGAAQSRNEPVELRIDRPFVFAVRDLPTGAILFLGHVSDPTKDR